MQRERDDGTLGRRQGRHARSDASLHCGPERSGGMKTSGQQVNVPYEPVKVDEQNMLAARVGMGLKAFALGVTWFLVLCIDLRFGGTRCRMYS